MRTYGRLPDKSWVEVSTDPATGDNSWIMITTLCQVLLLNLGESPFYSQFGLPDQQSVIQQILPDYYVSRVQQQFSRYFASLLIVRDTTKATPTYNASVTLLSGATASVTVQVPF